MQGICNDIFVKGQMKNGHLHSGHGGLIVKLSKRRLSQKGMGGGNRDRGDTLW